MTRLWAVVPAAGSGTRMAGQRAKQFIEIHGRSLLHWSVGALLADTRIRGCAIALPPSQDLPGADSAAASVTDSPLPVDPRISYCSGGTTRADSVLAGIESLPADAGDWVLVHDAARPCLPRADLARLIEQVLEAGCGGLLAQPLTDTLKRGDAENQVIATVDRQGLWRAQTPQMFPVHALGEALRSARDAGYVVTDEASAMERMGHRVLLVEGSACNLKVTYADDLEVAAMWLSRDGGRRSQARAL